MAFLSWPFCLREPKGTQSGLEAFALRPTLLPLPNYSPRAPRADSAFAANAEKSMASSLSCQFAPGLADANYRLFELDEPVLQEVLRDDGRCALDDFNAHSVVPFILHLT